MDMEQVGVEEARKRLGDMIMPGQPTRVITKNGVIGAVLIPARAPGPMKVEIEDGAPYIPPGEAGSGKAKVVLTYEGRKFTGIVDAGSMEEAADQVAGGIGWGVRNVNG